MKRRWIETKMQDSGQLKRVDNPSVITERRFQKMDSDSARQTVKQTRLRIVKAFVVAMVCHVLLLSGATVLPERSASEATQLAGGALPVVFLSETSKLPREQLREKEPPPEKPEEKEDLPKGQVVALPPDANAPRPEHADYLSETHHQVARETRSRFASAQPDQAPAHELQMGVEAQKTQPGEDEKLQLGDGDTTQKKKGTDVKNKSKKADQSSPLLMALAQRQARQALQLELDLNGRVTNQEYQKATEGNGLVDRFQMGQGTGGNTPLSGDLNQGEGGAADQGSIANLVPSFVELKEWTGAPQNDYLPEVETEDATRLNTWQFLHAPFFNRIANGVRRTWKPGFAIRRHDPHFQVYGSQARNTVLSITIDKQGSITGVDIYAASGAEFLDEEAVRAFKTAAPFPNPPKGLFGREETFTFNFGFNVDYQRPWKLDLDWQPYK